MNLHELETIFLEKLHNKSIDAEKFISSSYPEEKFNIYKQSIIGNLVNTLKLTYQGVWDLVGEECGNSIARAFCSYQVNMPSMGCLDLWGNGFPDFIKTIPELNSIPYLSDYAAYEWAKHICYISNDPIEYRSKYNIMEIEEFLKNNSQSLDLKLQNSYAIITKNENNEILTYWIEGE